MRKGFKRSAAMVLAVMLLAGTAIYAAGTAPVAENLELTTYRNVSVGGQLSAADPDGGELSYVITTQPTKGTLELGDDGHFIYTPNENKKGRDYFGYKAMDPDGNESQEATVIIRIQRKEPAIQYKDTAGRACDYAASELAETGIFTGPIVAGEYFFRPEETVSRDEFTAMCLAAAGIEEETSEVSTENHDLCYNDAAVILNDLLHISSVTCLASDALPGLEDWSAQAVSNLQACGILKANYDSLTDPLSREEAAMLLIRTMAILEAR